MKKFFNVAGPCQPEKHYMLSAQERCKGILDLIEQEQYFVIHAARQTGKTTLLFELEKQLNASGTYYVFYCSLEVADKIADPERGIPTIVKRLQLEVESNDTLQGYSFAQDVDYSDFATVLLKALSALCRALDKPLVVLFDEIDCLSNGTLISFLRQLRDGYINRSRFPFVHSIALVGMRNIRDYKAKVREDRETLGSASPFNIVSEALTLRNFTKEEVTRLYAQHTAQTEQEFPSEVTDRVYEYTCGQPWLVNAIAKEIVVKMLKSDFSQAIVPEHVEQAVQTIILRRATHIDSLMERLTEERVRRIVEPVILGESKEYDLLDDDYQYVRDLGLLAETSNHLLAPSNKIYAEIIIRILSFRSQRRMDTISYPPAFPAYFVEGNWR